MDGDALWSLDALTSLTGHPAATVRTWALRRLGLARVPAAISALLRALDHTSPEVATAAVEELAQPGLTLQREQVHGPLHVVAGRKDLPAQTTKKARRMLVTLGDAEVTAQWVAECLRSNATDDWLVVGEHCPAQYLKLATDRKLLSNKTATPFGLVALLPRHAPREALVALCSKVERIHGVGERSFYVKGLLRRGEAEHLLPDDNDPIQLREVLTVRRRLYARETPHAAVARYLGEDVFAGLLRALQHQRWNEAIAWSRRWCEGLHRDAEGAHWTRGLLQQLPFGRWPQPLDATVAACLAIAASERALEDELPFADSSLAEQFARTACGSAAHFDTRLAQLRDRWNATRHEPAAQAALSAVFADLVALDSPTACAALTLASKLPGIPLPEAILAIPSGKGIEIPLLRLRCLVAQPASLRTLAPVSLDHTDDYAQHEVLAALSAQDGLWVADLLRPRITRLLGSPYADALLREIAALGDVSLLPEALAAWAPGEPIAAETAYLLAQLADRVATLPPALVHEAETARPRRIDAPEPMSALEALQNLAAEADEVLRLPLRCNRCTREGRYEVGVVIINPDLRACEAAGWDGVTFERVVVCKFCGAEDDYTLTDEAFAILVADSMRAKLSPTTPRGDLPSGPRHVTRGIASVADGTHIRRASDALRHWQALVARDPKDAEAWLRLGNVLRKSARVDEARDAFTRAMTLRPTHLDTPVVLLDLLLGEGRVSEGDDLPPRIFAAMRATENSPEDLNDAARVVLEYARVTCEAGRPLTLELAWEVDAGSLGVRQQQGAVDLSRTTQWERLQALLASPNLRMARLRPSHPDDADSALERLLEGSGMQPTRALAASKAPAVRVAPKLGRNDPCHCGSGKKLKKCHGA